MRAMAVFNWFAGGSTPYMPLTHCMNGDAPWIALTVSLCAAVAVGYLIISLHWWRNQRVLADGPAKVALGTMRNIFVFCMLCGYAFIPIKMFWPAWRLFDGFLVVLVYFTWRYALNVGNFQVVYSQLKRSDELAVDLKQAQDESRRKSYFLNAISHDLRTPLNSLMLYAQLGEMSHDTGDREGLLNALAEIRAGVRATSQMLDGFLEIGKLDWLEDRSQVSRFPVDDLLREIHATLSPLAEQKPLRFDRPADTGLVVETDRGKLARVLMNLAQNALKFTDEGSVQLATRPLGEDVLIEVIDTGIGIAPADQAHLFEDFYQVQNRERDRSKGFGLGLAIADRLTRQLGGRLAIESELGRGSRFSVQLRGVARPAGARRDAAGRDEPPVARAAGERPAAASVG